MSSGVGLRNLQSPPVITAASRCALGARITRIGTAAVSSGASPWSDAANAILAFPFVIESPTTFYKGFWVNGGSAGGNSEVGIWDDAYAKIATTGSVLGSGASVPQSVALSATVLLPPGRYYAGMAHDATTTGQITRWPGAATLASYWQALGCWRQAGITLGSLAATATPGAMTNIAFPLFGLITRSVFDV